MKNNGTYRGSQPVDGWENRHRTQRVRREPYAMGRARFNNKPKPEGTLPPLPPVLVAAATAAQDPAQPS